LYANKEAQRKCKNGPIKQLAIPTLASGRQGLVHKKGKKKGSDSLIKSKKRMKTVMIAQPTLVQVIMETMTAMVKGEEMLDHIVQGEWDEGPYHDPSNISDYYHYDSS
jgi:hypothetical protein